MLYIKNGIVKDESFILINGDGCIITNPTKDMILSDGWAEYNDDNFSVDSVDKQLKNMLLDDYNSKTDITDKQALSKPLLIYSWDKYIGSSLKTGQLVGYAEKIYRVRQDISVVLENQYPGVDTAALYEVVELQVAGTVDDPIEFVIPMEIFKDKYYTYNGVKYLCTRDSQMALNNGLDTLVDIYVTKVE